MVVLQIVLLVAGFVLVVWGAVRAYRRSPRVIDNRDGTLNLENMEGGDPKALVLAIVGAILGLVGGLLGLWA
ncbi:hypothetical protein [Naasia sp. SYSU D00948]|uniref:hypothetical protein n=1 Tax=Naasia sp. SYSU D00948 TaxID=2817379 RepID=UPI001B300272|nr:hypothetical protein [Naasia sp. SYSU D00948]